MPGDTERVAPGDDEMSPLPPAVAATLLIACAGPALGQAGGVRLPDVGVSGKRGPCRTHPERAAETAELWMLAKEALDGSVHSEPGAPTLVVEKWRRTLGPRLDLRWERRDTARLVTLHPFETDVPSSLERAGYIQHIGWTIIFYGPDPDFLLSERFLRNHCFRRTAGDGAMTGLTGLAFEPLPHQTVSDVTGVLWIDPARGELRRVEYTWTNAPREADAPGIGGFSDYVRLASGGWITRRWNMRIPRFETGPWRDLAGYSDEGGQVLAVGESKPLRKRR
jgi:hypothetical protein